LETYKARTPTHPLNLGLYELNGELASQEKERDKQTEKNALIREGLEKVKRRLPIALEVGT